MIALAAAEGADVTVYCATRGEAGDTARSGAVDLGAVREAELHTAATILGVSRVIGPGFADSGMTAEPPPGSLVATPFDEVLTVIRSVVDEVGPDLVLTTDVEHGDGHRDHDRIGQATLAACAERPDLPVYAWAVERSLLARWLAELAQQRPDSEHLDLDRAGLGRPVEDITVRIDVSAVREVRERGIAAHASQQSPYDQMPAELRDEFLMTDRLVRLQPATGPAGWCSITDLAGTPAAISP